MIYQNITEKILIEKGWSADKKYRVTTADGSVYLLRVFPAHKAERARHQFARMEAVAALGVPMCTPLEFGIAEEGPYTIQIWIQGIDAEPGITDFPREQQYAYGLDAGRILKKIHSLPAPEDLEPWVEKFNRKIDRKLENYLACPLKYDNDQFILDHIASSRHLLTNRPQCFQHGDYHVGNMMIDEAGKLTIIDFDRDDYGDPWEEFNRIVWCAQLSPAFASGMVNGYFGGDVPMDFWHLLALYISSNTLSSLPWAIPFGEGEIGIMRRQAAQILSWYDNFRTVIPSWYSCERGNGL